MKNKKQFKAILDEIKKHAHDIGDTKLNDLVGKAKKLLDDEDDTGSNPPLPPPGNKPPGGG